MTDIRPHIELDGRFLTVSNNQRFKDVGTSKYRYLDSVVLPLRRTVAENNSFYIATFVHIRKRYPRTW